MPNSYDNPLMGETYTIYPDGTKRNVVNVRIGGGKRVWGGSQTRIKPSPLTVTAVTAYSTRYFDTRETWTVPVAGGNGVYTYYRQASQRYGAVLETSKDMDDGLAQARLRANSKLASGNLNSLVMVGEGAETARFVANRAFLLYRALRLIGRGNFGEAAQVLGSELSQNASKRLNRMRSQYSSPTALAANGWLEYQFAIRPLMGDAYGAVKEYHEKRQVGKEIEARARVQDGAKGTVYRAGILATVRSSEVRTLQQLGITNPLLAAWELVPLSFIIDWFLPIGPYLQYLDSTVGLTNVQKWSSSRSWQAYRAKDPTQKIEYVTETYKRYVDSWVLPEIAVGTNLNTGQLTTANALLQRMKR